jgi:hypothetical protein
MATQEEQQQQPAHLLEFIREPEDFAALYANNVQPEASVWDLKVTFGILDQTSQPNKVVQHTSINLPWLQVKILSYLIRANLLIHEYQNGKVVVPASVMPPDPEKLELPGLTPELREALGKIYKDFISTM